RQPAGHPEGGFEVGRLVVHRWSEVRSRGEGARQSGLASGATSHHFRSVMILYRLRCAKGHEFDSWFKDSKTYERQEKRSLIGCAVCGDAKVARAVMAPRIGSKSKK